MAIYPTAVPDDADYPDRTNDVDIVLAARYNEIKNEVLAICLELGISPSGASADVVTRLALLALKTNVLELDNVSAFTPDADYEPATKKYVDDNEGISDIIEDTTPQLGGYLDTNGQNIGSTSDEIENIYMGTNSRIYWGDGQEMSEYFNGTHLITG